MLCFIPHPEGPSVLARNESSRMSVEIMRVAETSDDKKLAVNDKTRITSPISLEQRNQYNFR